MMLFCLSAFYLQLDSRACRYPRQTEEKGRLPAAIHRVLYMFQLPVY